jgi:hypothetical protein
MRPNQGTYSPPSFRPSHLWTIAPALVACTVFFQCCCPVSQVWPAAQVIAANNTSSAGGNQPPEPVLAPNSQAPTKPVLNPNQYFGKAKAGYAAAKECPEICAKLFCYCGCDNTDEHISLLDCFTSDHGVDCYICQEEALVALQMKKKGQGLAEIQKVIDLAYIKEYPWDEKSAAFKKYEAAKLWKGNIPWPPSKSGSQGGASSAIGKSSATAGDAKSALPSAAKGNAKSSTKGSCCGAKSKIK